MDRARRYHAKLGTVETTATRKSWDLEVQVMAPLWHVEVMGTTATLEYWSTANPWLPASANARL